MRKLNNILAAVGNTPLVKVNNIDCNGANIYLKLESFNPLSSVKDRLAYCIIKTAEEDGTLKTGGTIVEASSGNTGIGLAFIAAAKGYKLILTMPESVSVERRAVLTALGTKLILTPKEKGMKGAIEAAQKILQNTPGSFFADQFGNPANPAIHRQTTAVEILNAMEGESVDCFVAGVGTGGTITGVGEVLKEKKQTKIVAVEPFKSPVLSGGDPAPHNLQGIGAGFIPKVLNTKIIDEIIKVKEEDAYFCSRELAVKEGVFAGISSGAAMSAALEISKKNEYKGKNIIVLLPDTGERYLSTPLWAVN
ncbi:Cysteine synthase [Elusimicrobium minutum Pei191]|uniref:cysteine synthase n=1 Tax=Elusimicrobium minutum (strain Pei191) TaxID=445932 RepID=B2KAP6_ELUMP|nr:cysteine synthase A [Elusimicrobium minutum]ACC97592.1 Cysteine synthase [Elusimicrobium minutum Pei191]